MQNKKSNSLFHNLQPFLYWSLLVPVSLYLLSSFFSGERGIIGLIKIRERATRMQHEITSIQAENDKLSLEVEKLKNNPFYIEQLAREKLGMVRGGEWIYQFSR